MKIKKIYNKKMIQSNTVQQIVRKFALQICNFIYRCRNLKLAAQRSSAFLLLQVDRQLTPDQTLLIINERTSYLRSQHHHADQVGVSLTPTHSQIYTPIHSRAVEWRERERAGIVALQAGESREPRHSRFNHGSGNQRCRARPWQQYHLHHQSSRWVLQQVQRLTFTYLFFCFCFADKVRVFDNRVEIF